MDEKDLNLKNENLNSSDGHDEKIEQPAEKIQEVDNTEATPAYEENDNWKFDGEAQTLNSNVIENDVFEIHIPESAKYETAERPKKATPITPQDSPAKTSGIKGDKVQFILISIILAAVIAVLAVFGTFYYTRPNSN